MGKDTKIEWATHTFNPWTGCTKVSDGCKNCYAERLAKRSKVFGEWGPGAPRKRTSQKYWNQALSWNREAQKTGYRPRVFCGSMCDVFDPEAPDEWRTDLMNLIAECDQLDWLLLTKRPEVALEFIGGESGAGLDMWYEHMSHAWIGVSVENQRAADERIPLLLEIPARVRFLSCEPLLGELNIMSYLGDLDPIDGSNTPPSRGVDWVIAGGESGPMARHLDIYKIRSLRDQCIGTGTPFFFKQWGEWGWVEQMPKYPCDGMERTDPDDALYAWIHGMDKDPIRLGKELSGCLLDGQEHKEIPTCKKD